jgi:nicotinate-nucleotide adenylyltransferase
MNIGIFGGTFDPPHVGHLIAVECAREILRLDSVRVIPAAVSPHKVGQERSPAADRLAMVRLAFADCPGYVIDDRELRRAAPSYMVDTLAELRAEFPRDHLVLLLGRDNLPEFETWREPERILAVADVVAMNRPVQENDAGPAGIEGRIKRLDTPLIDISSSLIRERVREGKNIRHMVPGAVQDYIDRLGLYR